MTEAWVEICIQALYGVNRLMVYRTRAPGHCTCTDNISLIGPHSAYLVASNYTSFSNFIVFLT